MKKTRAETDAALDELQADLPHMIRDTHELDLMEEFAGLAEVILERARPEDETHVHNRLQCMLRDAGMIPGDDEPCSD